MEATQVLDQVKKGITAAAKDAADAGDPGEAGTALEAAGMDAGAVAAAEEAGAPPPPLLAIPEIEEALLELARKKSLTERTGAQLVEHIVTHERHHAHRHGHRLGFRRGVRHALRGGAPVGGVGHGMRHQFDLVPDVPWRRSPDMTRWRWDIIERYARLHGGNIDAGIGFYYGTLQVPLVTQGPPTNPVFVMQVPPATGGAPGTNALVDSCFDLAIGDVEPQWLGGPHTLDLSDTNLNNPGAFLYPDQLMIIEAVSASLKAIRIQYYVPGADPTTSGYPLVNAVTMPVINGIMTGTNPVWDRNDLILPPEFFNQYNDTSELAQAVAMVTTIAFAWDDRGTGGNDTLSIRPVERMCAVPGSARQGVQETSGAGLYLDLPRGFIWCLDRQFQATEDSGGNGLFSAQLRQSASFGFPYTPVASLFGSSGPAIPIGCALEWQLTVWGTSLQPSKRITDGRREVAPRRRM